MDTYRVARLPARLRGFALPDTSKSPEGYVEAGDYLVLEEKARHPTPDTDYARLVAPQLSGLDTWVCTRWRTQRYAALVSQERAPAMARLSFDSEPLAVSEERLFVLLGAFVDYRYDVSRAYYPWALQGVRVPLAPPRLNNCCTFVEALLVKAFSEAHGAAFSWDMRRHRQMMIASKTDYFFPVTAAVESGMALLAPSVDVPPHPWTLIQGWRSQWGSGHTFLVVDFHPETDKVLVLESNFACGLDGVGYRGLGILLDVGLQSPADWWTGSEVWTWRSICSTWSSQR
ncbi:hypothetical protein LZ198_36005 [Myxococcus sp. K15C18031901]|uniref:hypothetical protein n=1 Tax=Myxococcus dinghuensis TaxID=2906761 RepID=UPI0020A7DA17|nr:hypothetical protein [Myxococcus dinghuensis]MCP3104282.1 hypothetical protein [Myxococcus dinghuensis]